MEVAVLLNSIHYWPHPIPVREFWQRRGQPETRKYARALDEDLVWIGYDDAFRNVLVSPRGHRLAHADDFDGYLQPGLEFACAECGATISDLFEESQLTDAGRWVCVRCPTNDRIHSLAPPRREHSRQQWVY
jgi:hypothetical protein